MKLGCSIVIALLASSLAEAATLNLAVGKKYSLAPAPNYAHCTDSGDAEQLTDGKSTRDYFWTQPGTVGWSGAAYATVTLDLGRVEPIGGAAFTTAAGVAGVVWPQAIYLLVSDDQKQWRNVAELVALDRQTHGPFPTGYAIRRLATDQLRTKGRFVMFMTVPPAGCPFLFVDEIEVFRGAHALASAEPGGEPVASVGELFERARVERATNHRFRSDVEQFQKYLAEAPGTASVELRARLSQRAANLLPTFSASKLAADAGFHAVLPLDPVHAQLFALQAEFWRASGAEPLTASVANRWDLAPLFTSPRPAGALEIDAMLGERRAAAFDLFPSGSETDEVRVKLEGFPTAISGAIESRAAVWTDSSAGLPVVAALPEAKATAEGWVVRVVPGLTQQVWLSFRPRGVPAGDYQGKVVVEGRANCQSIPLRLRVWPFEFPQQTTLLVGGWTYTDSHAYGMTEKNAPALVRHLRERGVNAPWATAGVLMQFRVSDNHGAFDLDTRALDRWLDQWPNASRYMVFLAAGDSFAGKKTGTPEFDLAVKGWITGWLAHLAKRGIGPERLGLLVYDEPNETSNVAAMLAWARALRAAEPRLLIWEDPTYQNPSKAPTELFDVCRVLCPNRPMWLEQGPPFAEFYLDQQRRGRELQFYSCSGPARSLDPYSYYRLQAWHAWSIGATGSFFWAFGDNGGASSWNEYLAKAGPYTPLFLDAQSVTPGKQMEAIGESVADFETLVMLRAAVAKAKATGRNSPAIAQAEALLVGGPRQVLEAQGAADLQWEKPKDRGIADRVRREALEAMLKLQ